MYGGDYAKKPDAYFAGARRDFVDRLPHNPDAEILEIGCGAGGTGAQALSEGKCRRYVGIDISDAAANKARPRLSEVLLGDVETMALPWPDETFDALIMSEVLEHLRDPWGALERLLPLVKRHGLIMASSPNISHHRVIRSLLRGRWELTESGVMDTTHLRWFTPDSFERMFIDAGVSIESIGPVAEFGWKAKAINKLTGNKLRHLFMTQICLIGYRAEG